MESIYTELALFGSKTERARTYNVFSPISDVCNSTVSLTRVLNFLQSYQDPAGACIITASTI